jgi:hypothetical protein
MPKLMLSLLLATITSISFAQKKQPATELLPVYGKVEKTDLESNSCEFDKNAQAMVLFDLGEVYCSFNNAGLTTEVQRHIRIKILNNKGLDQADIHIPFYSYKNIEAVRKLEAQTFNLDASGNIVVTKLEKKLLYEKKINKRYSEQVFTFPEVKAGSIIEYKYTVMGEGLVGLNDWYFQKSIPVKYSRYTVDFPNEFELFSDPMCVLPVDAVQKKKGSRDIKIFTMKNIPALRDEPFITCENDYLQRIQTRIIAVNTPLQRHSLTRTWPGIIKQLMEDEDFGQQLKRNIPRTADLDEQLKNITDPYRKMVIIHNYVRNNMEWNGYDNIWALDGVRSAWKEKKGTAGEINLILVNLLKDAGLPVHPVLVSTRENGRIMTSIPGFDQFNKVLAYVVLNNKKYVLDATEKYTPTNIIPLEVMYSEGLVISKLDTYEWGWETLWDEKQLYKTVTLINAQIDEAGVMKGEASINSFDYNKISRLPSIKDGNEKFIEKYFSSQNPSLKIDSLQFENQEADTLPLVQKVRFTNTLSSSADYKYFSTNMFTGLEQNPFVADNRFSDVFFAANQQYTIIGYFTIPDGYVFEELPKNIRMITPDTATTITRIMVPSNNKLSFRITLDFKKPFYTIEEYPEFKEFYKKLYDMLNEQVVIRKKVQP